MKILSNILHIKAFAKIIVVLFVNMRWKNFLDTMSGRIIIFTGH